MTAPVARISSSALAANAERVAAAAGADAVADLRRDGLGHGLNVVAEAVQGAGIRLARFDEQVPGLTGSDATSGVDSALLYGFPGSGGSPAMTLVGAVLSTKSLLAGEGVSYNHTYVAERDTRIALVTGGFGQGVVRGIGNAAGVEIGGRSHAIIGRVAMDVCVVDIGAATVSDGDEVVFFGGEGPARDALIDWREATGLSYAEMVCAVGLRVRRDVVA